MPNDLATMNGFLATQLRDTTYATWTSTELNNLLTWQTARLARKTAANKSVNIMLDPANSDYSLTGLGLNSVSTVELWNGDPASSSTNRMMIELPPGSWQITGDFSNGDAVLYINPSYALFGYYLKVHGTGGFSLTAPPYPSDQFVPMILAAARAEAYRRMAGDRVRFKQWQTQNQVQNVSVNELVLLINEADAEAQRLEREFKNWRRPVPGRI